MMEMQQLAAWLRASAPTALDLRSLAESQEVFVRSVCRAGLAGLMLERAKLHGLPLPKTVADRLNQHAMLVTAFQFNLRTQLETIVKTLNTADIPVMLLKGAALTRTVYDRPNLRPMSDVDLLVHPSAAADTVDVLRRNGCRLGYNLLRDDFFPRYHYERELHTDTASPVRIDLHARPLRPLRVSQTMPDHALWSDAVSVRLGESHALIPGPESMIVHLAAHAAYHACSRLIWLYDIKRVAEHYGESLNWELVTTRAADWRLSLPVHHALQRTETLLGPVCPSSVLATLASHRITWRDRLALTRAPHDADSPLAHVATNLLTTPGIRFRLGYLAALMLPGRSHLKDIYPLRHPAWVPCAHAYRMLRAFGRLLSMPFHGLARTLSPRPS